LQVKITPFISPALSEATIASASNAGRIEKRRILVTVAPLLACEGIDREMKKGA
jgi:hypothetical protein